ncbi:MAG: hypothetical protein QOC96_1706 [Acidobacteriota bacterium]|jgi:hypothetical protein|nr:hypothetical protein [Acidobacteriota bacterium]
MKNKGAHNTWEAWETHWTDYAESFAHPLKANNLLSRFITNSAVTGAYAETWIRFIAKTMLPQFRVSTGAIIRPTDRTRNLRSIPQCNLIIWNPSVLPALFEQGEFALVPFASVRAVIEVKRCCKNNQMENFRAQLKRQQKYLPDRSNILGLVITHEKPLFSDEVKANWLDDEKWENTPAITRLFSRSYKDVDINGVFAFIYFLSQVAGQNDLIVK